MKTSEWVPLVIAVIAIGGTLAATLIAQRGEARRAQRAEVLEQARDAEVRMLFTESEERQFVLTTIERSFGSSLVLGSSLLR